MIRALLAPFRRFLAGEKGTASLEFVISVPILMVIKAVCDRVDGLKPVGEFLGA